MTSTVFAKELLVKEKRVGIRNIPLFQHYFQTYPKRKKKMGKLSSRQKMKAKSSLKCKKSCILDPNQFSLHVLVRSDKHWNCKTFAPQKVEFWTFFESDNFASALQNWLLIFFPPKSRPWPWGELAQKVTFMTAMKKLTCSWQSVLKFPSSRHAFRRIHWHTFVPSTAFQGDKGRQKRERKTQTFAWFFRVKSPFPAFFSRLLLLFGATRISFSSKAHAPLPPKSAPTIFPGLSRPLLEDPHRIVTPRKAVHFIFAQDWQIQTF